MKKIPLFFIVFSLSIFSARADEGSFDMDRWNTILNTIQNRAIEMNISSYTINEVIQPSVFIPSIVSSDKNQNEFKLTMDQYLKNIVNQKRIDTGKIMRRKYPTLLSRVDKKYGVPPHVILAFWGIESNYGDYKSKYKLSDAFLTLIYNGRRETFFTNQLFALMKAADKDKVEVSQIYGSWAGAMGHFQFIPTTLEQYGVDGNGDGKIDIIHNVSDAMFSAGNYLSKMGWNRHEKIIREVKLPDGFDITLLDGKTKKPLTEWATMGITNMDGTPIPKMNIVAGIIADTSVSAVQPVDQNIVDKTNPVQMDIPTPEIARTFLTYPNFYIIKRWNNSNWYALAVALLAEEFK